VPWSTTAVSRTDRLPGTPTGPPRWLLILLAAGLSLLFAAVLVVLLGVAGVERINELVFVVVLVVAALAGGWVTRLIAPRLPPVRRGPRR
jgi:hypothetical protein